MQGIYVAVFILARYCSHSHADEIGFVVRWLSSLQSRDTGAISIASADAIPAFKMMISINSTGRKLLVFPSGVKNSL